MVENQNWTNEFSQSFKNVIELYQFLEWPLSPQIEAVAKTYPIFIPRSLALKIKQEGPDGILAREFLPHESEHDSYLNLNGFDDPIGDKVYLKAPQLIHRYKSRALFTPTTICPVHCRYCFRKNELNANDEIFQQDFQTTLNYLAAHPEISEIIFTGGDPFTLSNEKIEKYLIAFSNIKSIKDIRFHTRYPVILPGRIDDGLIEVLERACDKFRTVSIAIHANHVNEIDSKSRYAIDKLTRTRVQLLSQTVLMKGINDNQAALIDLYQAFIEMKVRPYYLHHPDQVKGGMHFYISIQNGRELYQRLRNELPGWAIPLYVIDIPGGHGKTPAYNPESTTFSGQLISREGHAISMQGPDLFA
jgi:lysine 2,3-aminomutase